uniref:Plant PDR ABC transporter associated domain-containing protein n=1 Tax=Rhizophora mucronata TaxID=61149 RepID=A0A2P2MYE8_RHIMU
MFYILVALQVPDNPSSSGIAVLKSFDIFADKDWFWIGAAALYPLRSSSMFYSTLLSCT